MDVVAHRRGEIERRNPIGRADLDNPVRIAGTAELVAELRLVTVERDELVAAKSPDLIVVGRIRILGPLRVVVRHRVDLRVASGVQGPQQAFQFRIVKHTHGFA